MMAVNSVLLASSVLGMGPFVFVHPSRLTKIASAVILGVLANVLIFSLIISGERRNVSPVLFLSTIAVSIMAIGFQTFPNRRALLREVASAERLGISIRWLGIVALTMAITSLFVHLVQRPTKLQLHLMRKFYHAVAMCIFIPGIMRDISWLRFCLILASTLFIMLEAVRLLSAGSWVASVLRMGVETFRNKLDSGDTILSHLWLLVGCAMPIWMGGDSNIPIAKLNAMSGVLTLGALDTAAAILGLIVNGPRWPGSEKTIFGSFAGLFAYLIGQLFVTLYYNLSMANIKWPALLLQGVICAAWEATSDQNDNLTLPLVALTASNILLY
jgi:dolichol kinase